MDEVKLPQHEYATGTEGNVIRLDDDGTFSISGYDGLTVLTKNQAREVAAMLLRWASA